MKILLLAPTLRPESGWGTYARSVAEGLRARGHDVVALTEVRHADDPCDVRDKLPAPLTLLSGTLPRLRAAWVIAGAVRRIRPDVIHALVEPYALALPLAGTLCTLPPWVLNCHGTYSVLPFRQAHTKGVAERAFAGAAGLLVCSEYTKRQALAAITEGCGAETAKRIETKMRPIRLGIAAPTAVTRTLDPTTSHVLFVGEVKPRKGVLQLIEGFAAYAHTAARPARLDIVGGFKEDSDYIQLLRSRIAALGVQDTVILRGHLSAAEWEQVFAKADALALLSRTEGSHIEGFGLALIEASARGIPTIGSDDSGTAEAIDDGVSGYRVHAEEPADVADKLRKILEEHAIKPEDCKAWAGAHSIERQTADIETVYREVAGA